MLEFAGRNALVTGGSRGIGRAIALELARHGARVAINYQANATAAAATLAELRGSGGEGLAIQADIGDATEVARLIETVRDQLGPIDLLVNNAGVAPSKRHTSLTFEDWRQVFRTNVDGPFLTTWAVKDGMIERGYGRIVNLASIAALHPRPQLIAYATSKAAIISFSSHCAAAFAPNVRVNCVAPGLIDTDMARAADPKDVDSIVATTPLARIGHPDDIASAVRFLLSDDSRFVTGETIVVSGGR